MPRKPASSSPSPSSAGVQASSNLARAVARRRRAAGLTLEELADRSGVSRTMLSEVERGQKSPTIRVACQIAEGLGCTVSDLLGDPATPAVSVVRRRDRPQMKDPVSGIERHVLSSSVADRTVEVVWYVIPGHRSTDVFPPHRAGIVEHVTVIAGSMELRVGDDRLLLKAGDTATYSADQQHKYRATTSQKCELLLLIDSSAVLRR